MVQKKILVVDDEPTITRLLKLNLEKTGAYLVREENLGGKAHLAARDFKPDLILLDVMMPDMDGPSTLRVLQQQGVTIPVIFLTAKVQPADRQKFMQLGVRGIISKPFDPLTLGQQIKEMLAW